MQQQGHRTSAALQAAAILSEQSSAAEAAAALDQTAAMHEQRGLDSAIPSLPLAPAAEGEEPCTPRALRRPADDFALEAAARKRARTCMAPLPQADRKSVV